MYKCPKCDTEFSFGTKFCENCGCNLEVEFIETPVCPKCRMTFPTGTMFCSEDGAKLVSPAQMIPRCVKCGKEYPDGTKFCPIDGGKIIAEALRTGIDFDRGKELLGEHLVKGKEIIDKLPKNTKLGILGGVIAFIVLIIVLSSGSPAKRAAKKLCRCFSKIEWNTGRGEREAQFCAEKIVKKFSKHAEMYYGEPRFKNPKYQDEFDEEMGKCWERLRKKQGGW